MEEKLEEKLEDTKLRQKVSEIHGEIEALLGERHLDPAVRFNLQSVKTHMEILRIELGLDVL